MHRRPAPPAALMAAALLSLSAAVGSPIAASLAARQPRATANWRPAETPWPGATARPPSTCWSRPCSPSRPTTAPPCSTTSATPTTEPPPGRGRRRCPTCPALSREHPDHRSFSRAIIGASAEAPAAPRPNSDARASRPPRLNPRPGREPSADVPDRARPDPAATAELDPSPAGRARSMPAADRPAEDGPGTRRDAIAGRVAARPPTPPSARRTTTRPAESMSGSAEAGRVARFAHRGSGPTAGSSPWPGGSTPGPRPRPSGRRSTPRSTRSAPWPRRSGSASTSAAWPPSAPRAVAARPSGYVVRGQSDPDIPEPDRASPLATRSAPPPGDGGRPRRRLAGDRHGELPRLPRRRRPGRPGRPRGPSRPGPNCSRYWAGAEPDVEPGTPRCDIYLYPDARIFAQVTGQPADSPGFSTMGLSSGRVVARRINLRADHAGLVEAVVPHEVAHVVLADLFPTQQIPRWADEGMAVLAEPLDARPTGLSDLDAPARLGPRLPVRRPDDRRHARRPLLGPVHGPERLGDGLPRRPRHARTASSSSSARPGGTGPEPALNRIYGFEGFDDLQARWLDHARGCAGALATRPDAEAVSR